MAYFMREAAFLCLIFGDIMQDADSLCLTFAKHYAGS